MSSKTTKDAAVRNFRGITNATQADAVRLLKQNNYRVEDAIDDFYTDPTAMQNAAKAASGSSAEKKKLKDSKDKLGALFDEYKDDDTDEIGIEGTQEYFGHLGLDLEDVIVLPLCYYLKAPGMGRFAREGFVEGWVLLDKADTIEKQKQALSVLRSEFQSNKAVRQSAEATAAQQAALLAAERAAATSSYGYGYSHAPKPAATEKPKTQPDLLFDKTYEFTYVFGKREGQKSLDLDTAIAFWELIIPHAPTFAKAGGSGGTFTQGQLDMWKRFLKERTNGRAISKDTWTLFLDFTKEIDPEFKKHDEDGAWPSVIDDFVDWARQEIEAGRGPDAMDDS